MAQFGKVLGAILGIQDTPKITEQTKQYWRDAKIYIDMIHNLEAKGISRERLQKAGLIIPELFEEHVRVSNMGGGPGGGGLLPVIPILGSSSAVVDQNVTDEQVATLRLQIQTLQIFPQNIQVINEMLAELDRPRAINEDPARRQRILRQIRDQYQHLERDENEYMNNMDNYSSSLSSSSSSSSPASSSSSSSSSPSSQQIETREVNNLLDEYRSARQEYEVLFTQLQAHNLVSMNPYALADDPTIWDNSSRDRDTLKDKIKKQIMKYNKYTNSIRLKLQQLSRQGRIDKAGTVFRTTRTNKTIDTDPLRAQLLDYFDRPNERQRNRMAVGSINPNQGGNIEQMRTRVRELINGLADEEDVDMNIVRKLREVQDNITEGKKRDGTPLEKLHNLSISPKPGPNKISRRILKNLLIKFASQQNRFAIYLNIERLHATSSTVQGNMGPINQARRKIIDDLLNNDANAQHMLDIFSYYGINLNGIADNAESWNKITDQINALPENEKLEIYNSFAYALKIFGASIVIRKSLADDETDLSKLTEVKELNERMLSQIEREAIFTPEQMTAMSERFGRMGLNQGHLDAIRGMNNDLSNRILAARGTQNLNFGELQKLAQDIKNAMAPEIMAMFQSVADDMDKAGFDYKEFFKFVTDIFKNKKDLAKAVFKPKIMNAPEIRNLYNQLTTNVLPDDNDFQQIPGQPGAQGQNIGAPIQEIMDMTGVSQATRDRIAAEAAEVNRRLRLTRRRNELLRIYGIYVARPMRERGPRGGPGGGPGGPPGGDPPGADGAGEIEIGNRFFRRRVSIYTFAAVLGLLGLAKDEIVKQVKQLFEKGEVNVTVPDKENKPKDDKKKKKEDDEPVIDIPSVIEYDDKGNHQTPGGSTNRENYPIPYKDAEGIFDTDYYNYDTKNISSNINMTNNNATDKPTASDNTHDVNYKYARPVVQKPFKVNIPARDRVSGASPIEYTTDIEENSVMADLVDRYNDAVQAYNKALDELHGPEYYKKLEDDMTNLETQINQANTGSLINERKFEAIEATKIVYKQTPAGNIYLYNYIPETPYTESIGVSDEIREMNKEIEQYNSKVRAGKYSASDLQQHKAKIDQLELNIRHISENPELARQLNQSRTLKKEYPKDVRGLMNTVITTADKANRAPVDYSNINLEDFPEVEKTLKRYNEAVEVLKTKPNDPYAKQEVLDAQQKLYDMSRAHAKTSAAQNQAFQEKHDKDLQSAERTYATILEASRNNPNDPNLRRDRDAAYDYLKKVRSEKAPTNNLPDKYNETTYNEAYNNLLIREQSGAGARTEGELYGLEGHHITDVITRPDDIIGTNYNSSRKDYFDAKEKFDIAVENGASRSTIEGLYVDMESKRQKFKKDEGTYNTAYSKFYRDLEEKGTYLNNDEQERAPTTEEEKEKFRRLQNIEKMIQRNKDATIEYNDAVSTISANDSPMDVYNKRIELLKGISNKYGLTNAYNTASSENLNKASSSEADDTMVKLPADISISPDSVDGHDRARFIDPAEYTLFVDTPSQAALDQQRFRDFSRVMPNNGLGSTDRADRVYYNPLLANQNRDEIKRFGNANKMPVPTRNQLKLNTAYEGKFKESSVTENRYQQPNYNDTRPSSFGQVYYEDVQINPYVRDKHVTFTDVNKRSNNWYDFENPNSVLHPDYALLGKSQHPTSVEIGEVSRPPNGYEYTNERSTNMSIVDANDSEMARRAGIKPYMTGDSKTMRNDNLFSNKRSIYDGLNKYQR